MGSMNVYFMLDSTDLTGSGFSVEMTDDKCE